MSSAQPAQGAPGLRERQKRDRRRQMLLAAQASFRERGFEATTIAEIAAHAGTSPATVFNYFGSKEALLLTLLAEEHRTWLEQVAADANMRTGSALDRLTRFFVTATHLSLAYLSRKDWRHVEAACIRQPDSAFVQQYNEMVAAMVRQLHTTTRALVEEGLAPPALDHPSIVAMMYDHWGVQFTHLITSDTLEVAEHTRDVRRDVEALIDALGPPVSS